MTRKSKYYFIKKMKSFISIIVMLLISLLCTNKSQEQFWFLEKDKNYKRVRDIFAKYVDFFPGEDSSNCVNCTWSLNPDVEYNLKVVFSFEDNMFEVAKRRVEDHSVAKYAADNDSLLVLNIFSTNENYGYVEKNEINSGLIEQDYFDNLIPVPNFSNLSSFQTNSTVCKLPEDFEIFVLDSKSGNYLDKTLLTDGRYMPSFWKHGYSKGVAVSHERKIIIYWVIIW
jgi:hypothetical protein